MDKKLLTFIATHAVIIAFILYHLAEVVNWYVLSVNLPQFAVLVVLAFIIPKRFKNMYYLFVLYYFLTTSIWFNNWVIALPNYLVKGCLAFGVLATIAALLSLWVNVSVRKLLMVCSFVSGVAYAITRSPMALVSHLSFVLTFLISLFSDFHFAVWVVNYITFFKRLREGTV